MDASYVIFALLLVSGNGSQYCLTHKIILVTVEEGLLSIILVLNLLTIHAVILL